MIFKKKNQIIFISKDKGFQECIQHWLVPPALLWEGEAVFASLSLSVTAITSNRAQGPWYSVSANAALAVFAEDPILSLFSATNVNSSDLEPE